MDACLSWNELKAKNTGLKMLIPKNKPVRCKKYLAKVRELPCVITGNYGVEVHHIKAEGVGGMGMKASDYYSFPLSPELHRELHDHGWKAWEEKYGSQWRFVAETMHQILEEG